MKEWNEIPKFEKLKELHPDAKYCFFDLDGTLLNTEIVHMKSIQTVLSNFLNEEVLIDDIAEQFYGKPERVSLAEFFQNRSGEQLSFADYDQMKHNLMGEAVGLLAKENQLIEMNMIDLIEKMRSDGWKLAIVTASGRNFLDLILNNINKNYFDFHLSCDDTEKTKPHPMPYLKAMELFGVRKPSEVVIFEDSPTGIRSAEASGGIVNVARWFNN